MRLWSDSNPDHCPDYLQTFLTKLTPYQTQPIPTLEKCTFSLFFLHRWRFAQRNHTNFSRLNCKFQTNFNSFNLTTPIVVAISSTAAFMISTNFLFSKNSQKFQNHHQLNVELEFFFHVIIIICSVWQKLGITSKQRKMLAQKFKLYRVLARVNTEKSRKCLPVEKILCRPFDLSCF